MMFVQSSGQAQSGPETTRSGAKNEILSSMVTALPSQPRTAGEPYLPTPAQKFVSNTGYSQTNCNEQVLVLRKALANYHEAQLGSWTWIMVRSEDWKAILRSRSLDPDSLKYKYYTKRKTFSDDTQVTQVRKRTTE